MIFSARTDIALVKTAKESAQTKAVLEGATDPDSLTAAVLDWRDRNDIKRLNGAERRDYTAQGRTYGPGNGPFTTLQEVKGLLGISPDLFEKIAPHITLTSQQRGFDPDLASPEFIELLLGGKGVLSHTNSNALPLEIQNYRTRSRRKIFRLVATLNGDQQGRMTRIIEVK
ncbi:type II secretion system protein GspK [Kiloniella litopenaei]|nr:type II secretion system protein GspK [Kiloniella litopenaei]